MPLDRLPQVETCCLCIPDLKTAAAIVAVLAIVTSPAVSWAVVRHSYVIRMASFISSDATRADMVDIDLRNVLSFGFGTNAGLAASCLSSIVYGNPIIENKTMLSANETHPTKGPSGYIQFIRVFGWIVLAADIVFLFSSIIFLVAIFNGMQTKVATIFMISAVASIVLSFIYEMMYAGACLVLGAAFPLFEFLFTVIDLGICLVWMYFLYVICRYVRKLNQPIPPPEPSVRHLSHQTHHTSHKLYESSNNFSWSHYIAEGIYRYLFK